jgi:hypothetical protein
VWINVDGERVGRVQGEREREGGMEEGREGRTRGVAGTSQQRGRFVQAAAGSNAADDRRTGPAL